MIKKPVSVKDEHRPYAIGSMAHAFEDNQLLFVDFEQPEASFYVIHCQAV